MRRFSGLLGLVLFFAAANARGQTLTPRLSAAGTNFGSPIAPVAPTVPPAFAPQVLPPLVSPPAAAVFSPLPVPISPIPTGVALPPTAVVPLAPAVPTPASALLQAEAAAQQSYQTYYAMMFSALQAQMGTAAPPPGQEQPGPAAATPSYFTNGAEATAVPTAGPAAAYFQNGAQVMQAPTAVIPEPVLPGERPPEVAVDAGKLDASAAPNAPEADAAGGAFTNEAPSGNAGPPPSTPMPTPTLGATANPAPAPMTTVAPPPASLATATPSPTAIPPAVQAETPTQTRPNPAARERETTPWIALVAGLTGVALGALAVVLVLAATRFWPPRRTPT